MIEESLLVGWNWQVTKLVFFKKKKKVDGATHEYANWIAPKSGFVSWIIICDCRN